MIDASKPVTRRTMRAYRMTIAGVLRDVPGARRIIVTLHGDDRGDWITLREAGRRMRVTLDIGELYRRGVLSAAKTRGT